MDTPHCRIDDICNGLLAAAAVAFVIFGDFSHAGARAPQAHAAVPTHVLAQAAAHEPPLLVE